MSPVFLTPVPPRAAFAAEAEGRIGVAENGICSQPADQSFVIAATAERIVAGSADDRVVARRRRSAHHHRLCRAGSTITTRRLAKKLDREESVVMGGTALTTGRGVKSRVDDDSHALPDGQSVPPNLKN